jgi:hypothetical protein
MAKTKEINRQHLVGQRRLGNARYIRQGINCLWQQRERGIDRGFLGHVTLDEPSASIWAPRRLDVEIPDLMSSLDKTPGQGGPHT